MYAARSEGDSLSSNNRTPNSSASRCSNACPWPGLVSTGSGSRDATCVHLGFEAGAVVGMDDIGDHRNGWGDVRCEAEDPVGFARPEQLACGGVPAPASRLTQILGFGEKRFAPPNREFTVLQITIEARVFEGN